MLTLSYFTNNYGATWKPIRDDTDTVTWCHAGQDNVPSTRICMITTVYSEELGLPEDTTDERVGPNRFVRTEDLGQSIQVMFAMEVSSLLIHPVSRTKNDCDFPCVVSFRASFRKQRT